MGPLPPRRPVIVTVVALLALLFAGPAGAVVVDGEAGSGPPSPRGSLTFRSTSTASADWFDVPPGHWARAAIDHVAGTNDWMRDFGVRDGKPVFRPDALETRGLFARALVLAFAPEEPDDPALSFGDLPPDDPFHPFASAAVRLGWMTRSKGNFRPEATVTTIEVHRALVLALGLRAEAAGLDDLRTANGVRIPTPRNFGTLLLGMRLGLRTNHADDALDVLPKSGLRRTEVAWSLYRAATTSDATKLAMAPYATIELPKLGPKRRAIVEFGVRFVGYPYVWGGEWHRRSPSWYCCGFQPVGGFDCSGITWWAMRAAGYGWSNVPPRAYAGWTLLQRSSRDMASIGRKLGWAKKRPGDLLFYDGNRDGVVDHVNVFLGRGWTLDSSSGQAGVTILRVDRGWYRDHFVHARRVIA